jgi:galactitol-specific phosphotransferase system IIB component
MNQSQFIQSKIENMCNRLVNDHSANPSQVDLLRAQLDMTNISKYMTHLNTDEGIHRISCMTRSMIASDEGSLAVIAEYLHCFKDIMTQ